MTRSGKARRNRGPVQCSASSSSHRPRVSIRSRNGCIHWRNGYRLQCIQYIFRVAYYFLSSCGFVGAMTITALEALGNRASTHPTIHDPRHLAPCHCIILQSHVHRSLKDRFFPEQPPWGRKREALHPRRKPDRIAVAVPAKAWL